MFTIILYSDVGTGETDKHHNNITAASIVIMILLEGSLLIISCVEGYHLAGGDMMISYMCTNGSWSPNPLNILCVPECNDLHHTQTLI